MNGTGKALAGLLASVIVAAIVLTIPSPPGLPDAGRRMAALFLVALILWSTEALPIAVTALLVMILQPI